jgi:hypothetical protein
VRRGETRLVLIEETAAKMGKLNVDLKAVVLNIFTAIFAVIITAACHCQLLSMSSNICRLIYSLTLTVDHFKRLPWIR